METTTVSSFAIGIWSIPRLAASNKYTGGALLAASGIVLGFILGFGVTGTKQLSRVH